MLPGNRQCCLPPGKITQLAPHFPPPIPPRAVPEPIIPSDGWHSAPRCCRHSMHDASSAFFQLRRNYLPARRQRATNRPRRRRTKTTQGVAATMSRRRTSSGDPPKNKNCKCLLFCLNLLAGCHFSDYIFPVGCLDPTAPRP